MTKVLRVARLGRVDFHSAWRWQQACAAGVRRGEPDVLALLEHPPVYTFGRRIRPDHLLVQREDLAVLGVEVVETNRGGDVTFHGPGQVVGYPIVDLRRSSLGVVDYVCRLEEVLIRTLGLLAIDSYRIEGRPGVWTDGGKVAAIGVRVEGGVSRHGFALNVDPDLWRFDAIVPCGLPDATVTSIAALTGATLGQAAVEQVLEDQFADVFGYDSTQNWRCHEKTGALS